MVVMMFSEMADGDALFHGEIKAAIMVMLGRLRKPSLRSNVIAPVSFYILSAIPSLLFQVLLFSAIGKHHVRVIEAYHDHDHLVMRTTPMFDMEYPNDELFITLSKWCLGGPSSMSTTMS